MEFKDKIGPSDTDLDAATNLQLLYSADWNNFKVFKEQTTETITIPTGGSGNTAITHGLGYVPACDVWVVYAGMTIPVPGSDIDGYYMFDFKITSTQLIVYGKDEVGTGIVLPIKYKIYYERIDA